MKVTERDIDLMGWILEEKHMTEKQVRRIFWPDISEMSRESYKRLYELRKAGFLKNSKQKTFFYDLHLITKKGLRMLRSFNRHRGLSAIANVDYSNYKHDTKVTDLRILFHEWGYQHWVPERILAQRGDLRHLPDGVIHHRGKDIAIEYEVTRKSALRYREIFFNYEFEDNIDYVIYVTETVELAAKLSKKSLTCPKIFFIPLQHLEEDGLNGYLSNSFESLSLHELMEVRI